MKVFIYFVCLIVSLFVLSKVNVIDAHYVLKNRLNLVNNFYVHFVQKISFSDKKEIEIIRGELWIKQPNLFHWHVIEPQESFLISDGETLWFYIPLIHQVTAYYLKNVVAKNIFLKLLFIKDANIWNDYIITQKKDWFYLKPVYCDENSIKEFKIKITDCGIIDRFNIVKNNNQNIDYYLFNPCINTINIDKFCFVLSKDIQLDDQRN